MTTVFWSAVFFVFYTYLGYPLLLTAFSIIRNRRVKSGEGTPRVSFIITAYNEQRRIREKLENTIMLDYPPKLLQLIVASDCSSDETDAIVRSYAPVGVLLVRSSQRNGKEAAQKLAVQEASGDILVFSDVATILRPDAIRTIVRNFADPTVGCVSSIDKVLDNSGKDGGEGVYVRYEMLLRNLETRANTLVGLSGSFFAARREVCQKWQPDLQSDFNTLLNAVHIGLRGVSDPESVGYYKIITDETKEYERKVRTVLRGIAVLMNSLPMLNPLRFGLFSWQLFSHKLCRWLVPAAMITAFVSNGFVVSRSALYFALFVLQLSFYLVALGGRKFPSNLQVLRLPGFFVLVNLSILTAWFRYFQGQRVLAWKPSER